MSWSFEDFEVGSRHSTYSRTITDGDLSLFCAFAGYHVPLFIDEEFAKTTPHGGRICPSSLIMTVSTGMTERFFRDNVVAQLGLDNGQFLKVVRPGDTIRTEVEILDKKATSNDGRGIVVFRDEVYNQRNEMVFRVDKTVLMKRAATPPDTR